MFKRRISKCQDFLKELILVSVLVNEMTSVGML